MVQFRGGNGAVNGCWTEQATSKPEDAFVAWKCGGRQCSCFCRVHGLGMSLGISVGGPCLQGPQPQERAKSVDRATAHPRLHAHTHAHTSTHIYVRVQNTHKLINGRGCRQRPCATPVEERRVKGLLQAEGQLVARHAYGEIVEALDGAANVHPEVSMVESHDLCICTHRHTRADVSACQRVTEKKNTCEMHRCHCKCQTVVTHNTCLAQHGQVLE